MKRRPALRFVVILLVVYSALTAGFHWVGPTCAAPLLPVLEQSLKFTHPEFIGPSFTIRHDRLHLETAIKLDSALPASQRIVTLRAELSARQLLVCPVIALSLLFAWPHKSRRKLFLAFMFAIALIAFVESLDTPYVFVAAIAEKQSAAVLLPRDFDSFWWFFLDNGGRQLLSLFVAPLAVLGTGLLPDWLTLSLEPVKSNKSRFRRSKCRPVRRQVVRDSS